MHIRIDERILAARSRHRLDNESDHCARDHPVIEQHVIEQHHHIDVHHIDDVDDGINDDFDHAAIVGH